jgi:putative ABC transport system permease protein
MSSTVTERTREVGIRMALGAERRAVVGLILGQGMGLVLAGLALGLLGAFGVTRVLSSLLYGVSPNDPAVFAGVALLLSAVAMLATYLPARRASRVDPMVALRHE